MSQIWVKLNTIKRIDVGGHNRQYHPGDFVQVGKATAQAWIAAGDAVVLDYNRAGLLPAGCGVFYWGDATEFAAPPMYAELGIDIAAPAAVPLLQFPLTLLVKRGTSVRRNILPAGFALLRDWDIAIPLLDYRTLALNVGTEKDRAITDKLIHDLRVPVFDIRIMFVRRSTRTERLFGVWDEELHDAPDLTLAMHRAVYRTKPLVLPLPVSWVSPDGSDGYA